MFNHSKSSSQSKDLTNLEAMPSRPYLNFLLSEQRTVVGDSYPLAFAQHRTGVMCSTESEHLDGLKFSIFKYECAHNYYTVEDSDDNPNVVGVHVALALWKF